MAGYRQLTAVIGEDGRLLTSKERQAGTTKHFATIARDTLLLMLDYQ